MTTSTPRKRRPAPEKLVPSFEVPADRLLDLIEDAAITASTDPSRPTLTNVRLILASGRLTAAATDSYMLCETWFDVPKLAKRHKWTRYLDPSGRDLLRPLLKAAVKNRETVVIRTDPGSHQVTFSTGSAVTAGVVCDNYPDFAPLWEQERGDPEHFTALSPEFMAKFRRFSAVKENFSPVVLDTNCAPTKAVRWTIGDHTRGMIMPVRIQRDEAAA